MKVLLEIEDKKAMHLIEVLKSMPYVKTKMLSRKKALLMEEITKALEELTLIRQGELIGIPAKELLDEL